MTVVRVVKDKNFITMGKYHFKEKNMSLKAIGLLSLMLSLPDEWDYSVNGLTAIRKESRNTINDILKELERFGYLNRTRIRDEKGKIVEVEYTVYERPYPKNQDMDNQDMENRDIDNCTQLNNKELNTKLIKEINNKEKSIKKKFIKPTLEEVEEYVLQRGSTVDAKRFYEYYDVADWQDVKNWKQKLITWETHQPKQKKKSCVITDEDLIRIQKEIDEEEREREIRGY